MPFQQKTLWMAQVRSDELCASFDKYLAAFESETLFSGPSLYFHIRTLEIRRQLSCSVNLCLKNTEFFESLYATLASWGLHRMGPGNAKLVDFATMVCGFQRQADALRALEGLKIEDLSKHETMRMAESIWQIIWNLPVGIGSTKIVSGSKALHHLLPDLVPPIDREYTVRFFFNNKNAIQGDKDKQQEAFHIMYPLFARVCRDKRYEIRTHLATGMNTSTPKIVDNAIVGYGRTVLKIPAAQIEDGD